MSSRSLQLMEARCRSTQLDPVHTIMAWSFACLVLFTGSLSAGERKGPPNVVLILADDLGYADLGCYGASVLKTPRIDRMSQEGMRFTRHYAGSTVCAPSRCVLMTGLHTGHCRVRGNSPGLLRDEDVTVPEILGRAGYSTACFGKWGIGNPPPLDDPNRHGFDHFFGYVSMWHAHNFYPEFLIGNGRRISLRNEVEPRWKQGDGRGIATSRIDYAPDLIVDRALQYISGNRDHPFFLYLALNIPHANNEATRSDRPERGLEVPSLERFADRDWPAPEKGFATMIHHIDRDVGRVLDRLTELELDRRTLVLFTSDNGPHQEGGHRMEFFDSNGSLRGMKRDLYEGGIRVPLIAWWPGRVAAGTRSDHVSGFQDLMPTLAGLSGQPVPDDCDGISMLPTLMGVTGQQQHDALYWEFTEQGGKRALLMGNWKLIQRGVSLDQPGRLELYDLKTDSSEQTDLASKYPEKVRVLHERMQGEHTVSPDYPLLKQEKAAN